MEKILGPNNDFLDYAIVVVIYFLMFLVIRFSKPKIELNYKPIFVFLFLLWAFLMFTGNYLFYLLNVMSFLPWLNNLFHSVIWVGLCLGWLYYCTYQRPMWEQFILFAFTSFIIKMAENLLLGSWHMDSYLGIKNGYAYLITMSIVDGFYPIISKWVVNALGKRSVFGIYAPEYN